MRNFMTRKSDRLISNPGSHQISPQSPKPRWREHLPETPALFSVKTDQQNPWNMPYIEAIEINRTSFKTIELINIIFTGWWFGNVWNIYREIHGISSSQLTNSMESPEKMAGPGARSRETRPNRSVTGLMQVVSALARRGGCISGLKMLMCSTCFNNVF